MYTYRPALESMENAKKDTSELAVPRAHVHAYCFSHFNYNDEIQQKLQNCGADFGIFQEEKCPTTANTHLQGYVYWKNKKRGGALIKAFPGANWRVARGNAASNVTYCSKTESSLGNPPVTWGEQPMDQTTKGSAGTKAKQDRCKILQELAERGDFATIKAEHSDVWWHYKKKVMDHYHDAMSDAVPYERDGDMPGVWIVGPAGSAKSNKAIQMGREMFDCPRPYRKPCKTEWWTNYKYENTVILDDLDPKCASNTHEFKTWIDRYSCQVRIHGGMIEINPENFIVTSQYTIEECFANEDPAVIEAMIRRFPTVIHMTHDDGTQLRLDKKRKADFENSATYIFGEDI